MNKWYSIENRADGSPVEISIYDEIGDFGTSAKNFIEEVKNVSDNDITLRINSVGGSVFDGLAIYNALRSHRGYVTIKIEGLAASISTVIAMAGDNIEMSENGFFMIHNPFGQSAGEAGDMRKTADLLDKIKDEIIEIYQRKTDLSYDELSDMMDKETWLSSQEAIELGFVNNITEPMKIAATFDLSKFTNVNEKEVNDKLSLTNNKTKMTEELKTWFNSVKEEILNAVKGEEVSSPVEEVSVILSDNEAVVNKFEELEENAISLREEKEELANLVGEKESTITDLTNKISDMEAKLAKLEATETSVEADTDPAINESDVVVNEWESFAKSILK
jgi:ATP-dependent Clp endopeptidase proteolytic subunit ClpP|tara:strand:+ start:14892 stop:15893 length:1002 start_codon:yes stop_codon:yes gene_type:complete